ncbi:MAG: EthD domain-containing protein [Gammaproteobacteria bacterium]
MIKGIALVARKPGMDEAAFHRYWRDVHGPLALRIDALRRYVQSHRKALPVPGFDHVPYDGVAEIWLDDLAAMDAFATDPSYVAGAKADEPKFLDMTKLEFLATTERVFIDEVEIRKDTRLTKAMFLLRRKPGMSVAEFQDYWVKGHAPQIPRDMGVVRYVQCHQIPETYARGEPPYDGVAELSFADDDAFLAYWTSPRIIEIFSADAPRFLDGARCTAFLVDEYRVRW